MLTQFSRPAFQLGDMLTSQHRSCTISSLILLLQTAVPCRGSRRTRLPSRCSPGRSGAAPARSTSSETRPTRTRGSVPRSHSGKLKLCKSGMFINLIHVYSIGERLCCKTLCPSGYIWEVLISQNSKLGQQPKLKKCFLSDRISTWRQQIM